MNDYSDLIFLIAAIAIYGLLVNNTNRSLVLNNQILTDSEIEYGAISVAQDVMEEVRWMQYENFKNGEKNSTINYLENLNTNDLFESNVTISDVSGSSIGDKIVDVIVTSTFLKDNDDSLRTIKMSLIKTDY